MDAHNTPFGCFTLQQTTALPGTTFLSEVGADGQLTRKRKVHTKSRSGCTSCKARKVKCDEKNPCRNCVKRNQECIYITPQNPSSTIATSHQPNQKTPPEPPPSPYDELVPINTEHLRLLHHFDNFTSHTFIMEAESWKKAVIKLALQNEFLMHAVFLVTATHLQHLQPHERGHQIVALENLSQVLPIFRNEIDITSDSKECPVELGDALIACAMLLIQYSWTLDSGEWSSLLDLYGLYHGMMSITISCIDRAPQLRWGSLSPMLGYSPRLHIERCMKDMAVPCPLDAAFLHCLTCTKISDTKPEDTNVFYDPIRRLSSILWALDLDHKRFEQSGLTFAASRYLFTLPHFFGDSFLHLLRLQDGRAQVILLYYFAAVSRLKSDQFWWMRVRAIHMFEHISHSLGNKCVDCTARAYEIFCGEDVDGVENLVISEKSEREATAAELEKERIQQKGFVPCSHGVAKQD